MANIISTRNPYEGGCLNSAAGWQAGFEAGSTGEPARFTDAPYGEGHWQGTCWAIAQQADRDTTCAACGQTQARHIWGPERASMAGDGCDGWTEAPSA